MTDHTDTPEPLLSRTGMCSPIGTLTEDLKTKVDPDTAQDFRRICAQAGTDPAGALRNYVCKVVHGKTYDELCVEASQRRRLVMGLEGPIEGLIPLRVVEQTASGTEAA